MIEIKYLFLYTYKRRTKQEVGVLLLIDLPKQD